MNLHRYLVFLGILLNVIQGFPYRLEHNFMQNITINNEISKFSTKKLLTPLLVLVVLFFAGLIFFSFREPPTKYPSLNAITANALEEQYGLRVNLIAVTAAGGFVDLRLKITDGDKAKSLLADKNNFPSLMVNKNIVLNAPEDAKSQEIRFNNDGNIFILYVNKANAVKSGSQIRVLFGDNELDPITVQ